VYELPPPPDELPAALDAHAEELVTAPDPPDEEVPAALDAAWLELTAAWLLPPALELTPPVDEDDDDDDDDDDDPLPLHATREPAANRTSKP
jgi:hypothetical protein